MNVVEFDKVSIAFGPKPALALPAMDQGLDRQAVQAQTGQTLGVHECSLSLREGEILVLMGLSGSGKSTLLRAVNGLNPITRGDVRLHDGQKLVSLRDSSTADLRKLRLNRVAMVFQQFGLLPWRNVRDNVGLGLEFAGLSKAERRERIDAQLELVGLAPWADRKVAELSGGMQQRVGLARAFVTEAPILLMDEPFSALDPLIRAKLQDELLDLQQRLKRSILFVSHDLDEAFKLGNRIALMEGGRIVQCATAREIIAAPATPYVADFVAHMNPLNVLQARDLMTFGPAPAGISVSAETPMRDVMAAMAEALQTGQTYLSVTDSTGPIGVIQAADVMTKLQH